MSSIQIHFFIYEQFLIDNGFIYISVNEILLHKQLEKPYLDIENQFDHFDDIKCADLLCHIRTNINEYVEASVVKNVR